MVEIFTEGGSKRETPDGVVHSFDDWMSIPIQDRALTLGAVIIRAQGFADAMTREDFFILGLAWNDKEAIAFLDQDAINRDFDFDFADASTPEAAYDALLRWSDGPEGKRSNQAIGHALRTGHSVHNNALSWADAILAVPFVVYGVAVAPTLWSGGAAAARWAASGVSTSSITLAVSGATGAMATTRAGQAFNYIVHSQGMSNTLNHFRRGGVSLARWLSRLSIEGAASTFAIDALVYSTGDAEAIAAIEALQGRQIRVADLERAGYTVSVGGEPVAAGEEYIGALDAETLTITDADGVAISPDEAARLIDPTNTDLPSPFADSEVPELIDPDNPPEGQIDGQFSNQVYGAADQYRATGSQELFDPENQARADKAFREERVAAAEKQRTEAYQKNPFIGFPDIDEGNSYYRVTDANDVNVNPHGRGSGRNEPDIYGGAGEADRLGKERGGPVYRANDVSDEISSWSALQVINFQNKAIEAGLIDEKTRMDGVFFTPGVLDAHTIRALSAAMLNANISGDKNTYDDAMNTMIEGREAYFERFGDPNAPPTWTPSRAYFAPDYTEISERVKSEFSRKLGRKANDWEMDLLADEFKSDHRAAYDAEQAGDKATFEAEGRSAETGETAYPGTFSEINPATRMADTFDEQFSDEIDAKSRWNDVQSKSRNLFGSFDKLSRA